jgi:PAS domain S-box-containing protein
MPTETTAAVLNIIYLENDSASVSQVRSLFQAEGVNCFIRQVDSRDAYLQALRNKDAQIILANFGLPDIDGFEALQLRKELLPDAPFIFVSGTLGDHTAVDMLKRGATDFVLKQAIARLPASVFRAIKELQELRRHRQSEKLVHILSEAMSQSPVAVEIRDSEGLFVYANRQLCKLTGHSLEDLAAMEPQEFYGATTPRETLLDINQHRAHGLPWSGELNITSKDGSAHYVRGLFSPMEDSLGEATHFVAVFEDLTEWKLEQQKRQDLEKQLLQAQKTDAIGALAGGIAHDFNNILTAIIGFAELSAGSASASSEDAENLHHIVQAGRRAKDLVAQILSFSRMQDQTPCVIDLSRVVSDILRLLRASLPSTIQIDRHLESCMVRVNPTQIHQIILNLCTNAEYAMRGRPGRLTISLKQVTLDEIRAAQLPPLKPGPCACLRISDTGNGMNEATMEHIFERFFTTKPEGAGSGLGLSVVRSIVDKHQGAIEVSSRVGEGSTFEIFLPLSDTSKDEPAFAAPLDFKGSGKIVVVVDDELSILSFLSTRLQRMGFITRVFRSSKEVESALLNNREYADLLFTDQTMPGMTGIELIRSLRRSGCDIPAILSSGYGAELNPEEFRDLAGVTKIDKPFSEDSLAKALHKSLD